MTKLSKKVTREVEIVPFGYVEPREYIVEISYSGISLREKGRRYTVGPMPWTAILSRAELYDANS